MAPFPPRVPGWFLRPWMCGAHGPLGAYGCLCRRISEGSRACGSELANGPLSGWAAAIPGRADSLRIANLERRGEDGSDLVLVGVAALVLIAVFAAEWLFLRASR